jgi:hypothetical protein
MDDLFGTTYTKEQFLEYLSEGECPFCHRKGFKNIMIHVRKKHGITRNEICDEALISRRITFLDEDTKKKLSENAKKHGFGITIRPTEIRSPSWSDVTRKKQINDRNRPERKKIFYENCMAAGRKYMQENPGHYSIAGKVRSKNRWGSEEGYSDLFYAKVAKQYIEELNTAKTYRNVLANLAEKIGVAKHDANYYINTVCKKRGLIEIVGNYSTRTATLTDKAKNLLGYDTISPR